MARERRDILAVDVMSRLGAEAFSFFDKLETTLLSGDAKLPHGERLRAVLRRPTWDHEGDRVIVEDIGEETAFLYFMNNGTRVLRFVRSSDEWKFDQTIGPGERTQSQ